MGKLTLQQAIDLFKRKIKVYTRAVDNSRAEPDAVSVRWAYLALHNFGRATFASSAVAAALSRSATRSCATPKPPEITEQQRKEQRLFKSGVYSNTDGKVLVFPVENSRPRYARSYQVDVRPYAGVAPNRRDQTCRAGRDAC